MGNLKEGACPFCNTSDFLVKDEYSYVRWDVYPVSEGHALIVPFRHVSSYFDLTNDERKSMFGLLDEAKRLIEEKYNPDGFNIGINDGEAAGQTIMHVHMHLIPRYEGDMKDPRGGVRGVIPEKQKY